MQDAGCMFCGSVGIRFGYLQFMSLSVSLPTTTNTNTYPYLLDIYACRSAKHFVTHNLVF